MIGVYRLTIDTHQILIHPSASACQIFSCRHVCVYCKEKAGTQNQGTVPVFCRCCRFFVVVEMMPSCKLPINVMNWWKVWLHVSMLSAGVVHSLLFYCAICCVQKKVYWWMSWTSFLLAYLPLGHIADPSNPWVTRLIWYVLPEWKEKIQMKRSS